MRLLAVVAIWSLLIADAICADNTSAVAFSRANAEKFKNEIREVKGLTWGTKITVTGTIPKFDIITYLNPTYDPENSEMVLGKYAHMGGLTFFESCRANGSFLGQNAFGVKAVVRHQTCESFRESGVDLVELVDKLGNAKRIRMSPSQFRLIMKNGTRAEIDFTIGNPGNSPVVEFSDSVVNATIDSPIQTRWKVWTMKGQESAIRWFMPGEKESVEVWSR